MVTSFYLYHGALIPERPLEPPDCWAESRNTCEDNTREDNEDDNG